MFSLVDLALLFAFCLIGFLVIRNRKRSVLPYPPGPKRLPLLGNLLDLPKTLEWETYARWSKEYNSDIIYLKVAGTDIIVVNSQSAANDIFEKKSSIYSSRGQSTMVRELMGWDWLMSAMEYGERWRERRRLFQSHFHPNNSALYRPTQIKFIREMLPRLLESPTDFFEISRHTIGAIALSLAYGLNIQKENDPFIKLAQEAVGSISIAAVPGAFLVDMMPILKYVPAWVPGAGFQKKARGWKKLQAALREKPFQQTKVDMASGIAKASFASICLETLDHTSDDADHKEEAIKDTAGIIFGAAADTTLSGIQTFFVAMLCYPEVQKKAQDELDRVLGGRLPEFDDEDDLPYLSAVVKEIIRWKPATPIAVPHLVTEDDVYKGYHIPKKAIVIGNAWAMLHNEEQYPNPSTFDPERFLKEGTLNPGILDPSEVAFGFGRRVCPGRHVGLSVLWLTAATILSTFNINKAKDENGNIKESSVQYYSGLICRPLPFECEIVARSEKSKQLIRSATEHL